ncbi:MAG: hypothetical protein JWP14_2000 [Frankiales bacterium]|nr:hypothetical protein [Frankiales bacterium]
MNTHLTKGRALALGAGATGLAAVALLGGGIAAAAGRGASSSLAAGLGSAAAAPSGTPTARPGAHPGRPGPRQGGDADHPGGPGGPRGRGPGGPGAGGPDVLHGRFVRQSGTSYVTEDVQQGTVTAVGATSLTVRSADGYSETYVLTGSTTYGRDGKASDLAVGDPVRVRATVAGGTATATSVDERRAPAPKATASPSPSTTS